MTKLIKDEITFNLQYEEVEPLLVKTDLKP